MAGLAVLRGQAGRGVLGERVAIPQMKRTRPVGSGGEAESVNTERGGSLRPSHNPTHNCLALYCRRRGPAVEVRWYKYGNDDSMGLASCGRMWSGSRAPLSREDPPAPNIKYRLYYLSNQQTAPTGQTKIKHINHNTPTVERARLSLTL